MIFAKEITAPFEIDFEERDLPIFARVDLDQKSDLKDFLASTYSWKTPIIIKGILESHGVGWNRAFFNDMVSQHVTCAKILAHSGFTRIVIAADGDGALQKILSPRYSSLALNLRMALLLEIFSALRDIVPEVLISLAVEELAPGGLDATDGLLIAKALQELGLKEIIATSGTRDFTPLYDRRATRKKHADQKEFSSHEPSLASALWLLQNSDLAVWCLAFIDDRSHALDISTSLGLTGLIEKVC
jgi:hypothetical protein